MSTVVVSGLFIGVLASLVLIVNSEPSNFNHPPSDAKDIKG